MNIAFTPTILNVTITTGGITINGAAPIVNPVPPPDLADYLGDLLLADWSTADHNLMTDGGGGAISSWADRINGLRLTTSGTACPIWRATWIDDTHYLPFPTLTFDGVDDCMTLASFGNLPVGAVECEIFIVAAPSNTISAVCSLFRYGADGPGPYRAMQIGGTGRFILLTGVTGELLGDNGAALFGPHLVSGKWQNSLLSARKNGRALTPASVPLNGLNTGTTRGRLASINNISPSAFFPGQIMRLVVTKILTTEQRFAVEGNLADATRLRTALPAGHPYVALHNFNPSVTAFHYVPGTGQSNRVGNFSQDVVTAIPLDGGRGQSFNVGPRTLGDNMGATEANTPLPDENIFTFVDLHEYDAGVSGETISSGFAHRALQGLASNIGFVSAVHGIGGQPYTSLQKGTVMYANLLKGVTRAKQIAESSSLTMTCYAVDMVHGEADHVDAPGEYYADLLQLHSDLDTDIRAIMGEGAPAIKIIHSQEARYTTAPSRIDQLQLWIDHPDKFIMVGPRYPFATADGLVHLNAVSHRLHGAQFGRAYRTVIVESGTYKPLYCTAAHLTGSNIVLTFDGNTGNLTLDTVNVTDPGTYGFRFAQTGGNSVSISSVTVTASNQVTTALSAAPTGTGQMITIAEDCGTDDAGPTTGPRCCLRDSDTDVETIYDPNSNTTADHPMWKWACHQKIAVT